MGIGKDKIHRFIVKNKYFLLSLPVAIVFLSFSITSGLNAFEKENNHLENEAGYNTTLPYKKNNLEVNTPNEYYKTGVKDSISKSHRVKNNIRTIGTKTMKDSLDSIIQELDNFSFHEESTPIVNTKNKSSEVVEVDKKETVVKETVKEAPKQSIDDLLKYAGKPVKKSELNQKAGEVQKIKAVINKEIIIKSDGEQVQMRLLEDLIYDNKLIKKGTVFYGFISYAKHRVHITVNNISGIEMPAQVLDGRDKSLGIYIKGGNLIPEIKDELYNKTIDEATKDNNLLDKVGNVLKKKTNTYKTVRLNLNHSLIIKVN